MVDSTVHGVCAIGGGYQILRYIRWVQVFDFSLICLYATCIQHVGKLARCIIHTHTHTQEHGQNLYNLHLNKKN